MIEREAKKKFAASEKKRLAAEKKVSDNKQRLLEKSLQEKAAKDLSLQQKKSSDNSRAKAMTTNRNIAILQRAAQDQKKADKLSRMPTISKGKDARNFQEKVSDFGSDTLDPMSKTIKGFVGEGLAFAEFTGEQVIKTAKDPMRITRGALTVRDEAYGVLTGDGKFYNDVLVPVLTNPDEVVFGAGAMIGKAIKDKPAESLGKGLFYAATGSKKVNKALVQGAGKVNDIIVEPLILGAVDDFNFFKNSVINMERGGMGSSSFLDKTGAVFRGGKRVSPRSKASMREVPSFKKSIPMTKTSNVYTTTESGNRVLFGKKLSVKLKDNVVQKDIRSMTRGISVSKEVSLTENINLFKSTRQGDKFIGVAGTKSSVSEAFYNQNLKNIRSQSVNVPKTADFVGAVVKGRGYGTSSNIKSLYPKQKPLSVSGVGGDLKLEVINKVDTKTLSKNVDPSLGVAWKSPKNKFSLPDPKDSRFSAQNIFDDVKTDVSEYTSFSGKSLKGGFRKDTREKLYSSLKVQKTDLATKSFIGEANVGGMVLPKADEFVFVSGKTDFSHQMVFDRKMALSSKGVNIQTYDNELLYVSPELVGFSDSKSALSTDKAVYSFKNIQSGKYDSKYDVRSDVKLDTKPVAVVDKGSVIITGFGGVPPPPPSDDFKPNKTPPKIKPPIKPIPDYNPFKQPRNKPKRTSKPKRLITPGFGLQNLSLDNGGFSVFVREKGFFKLIGADLSKTQAINMGVGKVKGGSAATFKIPGLSKDDFIDKDFYSKKGGLFIQKRGKRISSSGEVKDISRKGQAANRKKKNGVFDVFGF